MRIKGSQFLDEMGAALHLHSDNSVIAAVALTERQAGPPAYAHGGALAALIDEAMGAAAHLSGSRVVAVHLSFDYKQPVPLGVIVQITGKIESKDGRKVFTLGSVTLPNGTVAVTGRGIFVEAPQFFDGEPPFEFAVVPDAL